MFEFSITQKNHLNLLRKRMMALSSNYQEIGKICNFPMKDVHDVLTLKVAFNFDKVMLIENAINKVYFKKRKEIAKYF